MLFLPMLNVKFSTITVNRYSDGCGIIAEKPVNMIIQIYYQS